MVIRSLLLNYFRNHRESEFEFTTGKNLIYGANGVGKTSILEAVFLLGFGKSFLNIRKEEIIQRGRETFLVKGSIQSPWGVHKIVTSYQEGINMYLDDKKITLSRVNRYFFPVVFTSTDFPKYLERKAYKRKLFNRFIFGFEDLYLHLLLDYNKTVRKKNILLKRDIEPAELRSWNRVLVNSCVRIVELRNAFVCSLNRYLGDIDPALKVEYRPSLDISKGVEREGFLDQLTAAGSRERKYGRCLVGPHLDDYAMMYKNRDVRTGSSGEKKLNLLMIFVAMLNYYRDHRGDFPVFLIDDFDSAIDDRGLDFFFSILPDLQVVATSIDRRAMFENSLELVKEN